MNLNISFFVTNLMLGAGLAMDAFSVSMADGLNYPTMKKSKMLGVAGVFAAFQAAMPFIGWICVSSLRQKFEAFAPFIPWIALILLVFIGGKMLLDGIRSKGEDEKIGKLGLGAVLVQGVATSIDALSVGFTISEYNLTQALIAVLIIAVITFIICTVGLLIGKKFGTKLSNKAQIFGGIILIAIGIEIFITA